MSCLILQTRRAILLFGGDSKTQVGRFKGETEKVSLGTTCILNLCFVRVGETDQMIMIYKCVFEPDADCTLTAQETPRNTVL